MYMKKKGLLILGMAVMVLLMGMQVFAGGLDEVIAVTQVRLVGDREHVRSQETNLGNLINDIIREQTGADVAVYNGGGIRAAAEIGDITLEKAMEILAFNNEVVTLEMTGAGLVLALEKGYGYYPNPSGSFLQVSGLRVYLDTTKEPGNRVVKVYVGDALLELEKTYVVATNEFLAAGGDGYDMMKEAKQLETFEHTDQVMFIRYLMAAETVFPKVEGRIVILK